MAMRILLFFVRCLLRLRYRVTIRGLDGLGRDDGNGRLFLPNHPALVDPVILVAWLWPRFRIRPFADARQVDRPVIGWLANALGVVRIPDASREGAAAGPAIGLALAEAARRLADGENILLYPAGRLMTARREDLGATSAAEQLLRECPTAVPVAVRTRGLWGSSFGCASGSSPDVARILRGAVRRTLASGIFFLPRRRVDVDLVEAYALPRREGRRAVNAWLEKFHNEDAPPRLYVPRSRWEQGGVRVLPDPEPARAAARAVALSDDARAAVDAALTRLSGVARLDDPGLRLAGDLGLDSLAVAALAVTIEQDFGVAAPPPDRLVTVADAYAAAAGHPLESPRSGPDEADRPAPPAWFRSYPDGDAIPAVEGDTLPEAFLALVRRAPNRPLLADRGAKGDVVKSARDMLAAVHALAPALAAAPGERVGIMLPAGAAAFTAFYAALFAGKTPVLFNWTLGAAPMAAGADALGVRTIVTAGPLVAKLAAGGLDLAALSGRFLHLDQWAAALGARAKLRAWMRARLRRGPLAPVPGTAAILFTSGSEAAPKRVPLTHANVLSNLRDVAAAARLRRSDILLAMLPPFHSFGLLLGLVAPGAAGLRAVYHPNPLEGAALAGRVQRYKATILAGTPTFVDGIVRAATGALAGALASVRIAVTGAEACRPALRALLRARAPAAAVIEGYGITECSPILSVDDPARPTPGSVGRPLASVRWRLADPEDPSKDMAANADADGPDRPGLLLVRGPGVFGGYEGKDAPDPFVERDGERWYNTGDLIRADAEGRWFFAGRRKRFAKLGGEMVSLPAVEAVLERFCPPTEPKPGEAPRPTLAVVAVKAGAEEGPGESAELWLVAAPAAREAGLDRETANRLIRDEGLSGLHTVKGVLAIDAIPLLGTGKTDYRALQRWVEGQKNRKAEEAE